MWGLSKRVVFTRDLDSDGPWPQHVPAECSGRRPAQQLGEHLLRVLSLSHTVGTVAACVHRGVAASAVRALVARTFGPFAHCASPLYGQTFLHVLTSYPSLLS